MLAAQCRIVDMIQMVTTMQTTSYTDKTIQTIDGAAWNDNDNKAIN